MTGTIKVGKFEIKKIWLYIVFIIISFIQLGMLIYTFQYKKEGYHSDELWSYGYANSYYSPYVYQDIDGNAINQYEWVDGSNLYDYLVVNKGQEFSYGSVLYNHTYDLSPPLHSLILHTICSFFPDTFSPWYSFAINIVSFIFTIIFLFLCVKMLKNEAMAILVCAWYGFSSSTIDNFLYLRPYALGTALFTILLYLNVYMLDKIKKKEKISWKLFLVMGITAFLGFMTHFYVILATGVLTALICIYLIIRKQFKVMFAYGGTMLAALGLTVLCCSNMFSIIGNQGSRISSLNSDGANYTFVIRFKMLINAVSERLIYMNLSYTKSALPQIILACIIFLIILSLPLIYLLRNTKAIASARKKAVAFFNKPALYLRHWSKNTNWFYMMLLIMIIIYIIVVSFTSDAGSMGIFISRYMFILVPAITIMLTGIIHGLLKIIFSKRRIVSDLITFILLLAVIIADLGYYGSFKTYFFRKKTVGQDMTEAVSGTNCIYVDNRSWMIEATCERLRNVNSYFQVKALNYDQYTEEYTEAFEKDEAVMLVVDDIYSYNAEAYSNLVEDEEMKQEVYDYYMQDYYDIINYFNDLYPDYTIEKVSEEIVYSYKMDVYILKPAEK